jgi:lipopolysaccharide export system protein LptA
MDNTYLMSNFCYQTSRAIFRIKIRLLITSLLLCCQSNVWATNAEEEVLISADHMHLNIESGNSVYTGNVKVSQGEVILTGNKITVKQINNVVEKITVLGKPARYNHVTEEGETITAESEQMVYKAFDNELVLTINAKLEQPDHKVSSQKIIYDTEKRIIIAGDKGKHDPADTGTNNNRVNITLTPKKQTSTQE